MENNNVLDILKCWYEKLSQNKKLLLSTVTGVGVVISTFLFIIIKTQIKVHETKRIVKDMQEAEIVSETTYQPNEELVFMLNTKKNLAISFGKIIKRHAYAEANNILQDNDLTITTKVVNMETLEEHPIRFEIEKRTATTYLITGQNAAYSTLPGKYQLQVSLKKGEANYLVTQDFSWGVLAINPTKSIYSPGDTAEIHLAVLDEKGGMVCNAGLELEITNPQGETALLSTQNGLITTNPECELKELVTKPDYETFFKVDNPGIYKMKLTAYTQNGEYTITDNFEAWNDLPFEMERITATRIYPLEVYPVIFKVTPKEDFKGYVYESTPLSFDVQDIDQKLFNTFVPGGESYQQPSTTLDKTGYKEIKWSVDWKAGQTYYLAYQYDAPNISPQFFLLGRALVKNQDHELVFSETRQWQIAVDEASVGEWWEGLNFEGLEVN